MFPWFRSYKFVQQNYFRLVIYLDYVFFRTSPRVAKHDASSLPGHVAGDGVKRQFTIRLTNSKRQQMSATDWQLADSCA